jgi:hypothetical protein
MDFEVSETFLSVCVAQMDRAVMFYSKSLGAATTWASPRWSSLNVAGVRIGLFDLNPAVPPTAPATANPRRLRCVPVR